MRKYLLLSTLILFISFHSHGQTIYLDDRDEYNLGNKIKYILTKPNVSLEEVNELFKKDATILKTNLFNQEPHNNLVWLKIELLNNQNAKKVYFKLGRVDIHNFEVYKSNDNTFFDVQIIEQSGDSRSFYKRKISIADLSFSLALKSYEKAALLIKIDKQGEELSMKLSLQSEGKFYTEVIKDYQILFFYFGVLCFIFIFNLFLWINLKDKIHIIYLGIVLSNFVFVLTLSGLGFQYLWPNVVNKNSLISIISALIYSGLSLFFLLNFLNVNEKKTHLHRFVYFWAWMNILAVIPSIFIPIGSKHIQISYIELLRKAFLSGLGLSEVLVIITIIEQILKKNRYAIIYAVSMSLILIGGGIYIIMIVFGVNFWIRPSMIIFSGNLFELIVLSYGLTLRYNNLRKQNIILELNMTKIQAEVGIQVIKTQEAERKRLAQDLHDDLGGTLSAIKGRIANEETNLETIHLVEKAIEDLRIVSRNLLPPELSNEGLAKAIHHTIERLQRASSIKFTYITFGKQERMSEERELNVYRIVSEILNNIIKHSQATSAIIQIVFYEENLHISVEDNGIGIKTDPNTWGIGLKNIHSRVEFLKAKMLLDSSEKGTTTILDVPYH